MRDDQYQGQGNGNGDHPPGVVEASPGPVALAFGQKLKEIRLARPKGERTYRDFAAFLGEVQPGRHVSPGHLCEVEKGGQPPSRAVVERIDQQCGTNLIALFPELKAEHVAGLAAQKRRRDLIAEVEGRSRGGRRRRGSSPVRGDVRDRPNQAAEGYAGDAPSHEAPPDDAAAIEEAELKRRELIFKAGGAAGLLALSSSRARKFLQWAESSNVGPLTIEGYEESALWISENSHIVPIGVLFDKADKEFIRVSIPLRLGIQRSKDRRRMELLAGQFAYYQGRFAWMLGDQQTARDFLRIAQHYGEQLDNYELLGSIKIIESSAAFYTGRFEDAVWCARRGQRYGTPHTVARLAGNEARALGAIGPSRRDEMRDALDRAEAQIQDRLTYVSGADLPFGSETLALYGSMACLGAGDPAAEQYARNAVQEFQALRDQGSTRAHHEDLTLARLGIAGALATGKPPEPTEAARVAIAALAMPRPLQTEPVKQRATQLVTLMMTNWPKLPLVRELAEVVRGYRPVAALPARPARPGLGSPERA